MSNVIKGKGQRLIPEDLLKYLQEVKNTYPEALEIVTANPTLSGDESALESIEINGVKYKVGGSDVHLYAHFLNLQDSTSHINLAIYSSSDTAFTVTTLNSWLTENGFNSTNKNYYSANGFVDDGNVVLGICPTGTTMFTLSVEYFYTDKLYHDNKVISLSTATLTDTITQIF